ncbi:MAG: DUF501 domain-containing protein [Candidatus Acetothermia bacterium]
MVKDDDLQKIQEQIGRNPKGLVDVAFRCPGGQPAVIRTKPLIRRRDGFELFPTLFWLTCPSLAEQIAEIESRGYIERLEEELNANPWLKQKYLHQERRYRSERRGLLSLSERNFVASRDLWDEFSKGIGGIEDRHHIKCLHLHVAHHLPRENVLGKMLMERFNLTFCSAS